MYCSNVLRYYRVHFCLFVRLAVSVWRCYNCWRPTLLDVVARHHSDVGGEVMSVNFTAFIDGHQCRESLSCVTLVRHTCAVLCEICEGLRAAGRWLVTPQWLSSCDRLSPDSLFATFSGHTSRLFWIWRVLASYWLILLTTYNDDFF